MRTRRLAGAGLGLLATAAFGVAGCTEGGTGASPGVSASPSVSGSPDVSVSGGTTGNDAAAALAASTTDLGSTSFKITMSAGTALSMTGTVDPPNGVGSTTLQVGTGSGTVRVQTLLVGQDLYLKLGEASADAKWMHVDVSRLPEGANIGIRPGQVDPANAERLLKATTEVRQVDARNFAGTLDLTRVVGVTGISKITIDGYGEAARTVPFRASLDEQGRLSTMTVDLPAVAGQQAQPLEVRYSDFGSTVTVTRPTAAEVTEAPESVYTTLGGR